MRKSTIYAIIITVLFIVVFMIIHPIALNMNGFDLAWAPFALGNAITLVLLILIDVRNYKGNKAKVTIFFEDFMVSVVLLLLYTPIIAVQGVV